jgi:AraC-like DNA-binding protein
MRTLSIALSTIPNWCELARQSKYQAPLLAWHFGVSLRTLEREFQRQLGTSPQQKLNDCRQAEAEKLARQGVRTKEIAFRLEYKKVSHFCRHWQASHGKGVRAWRNTSE